MKTLSNEQRLKMTHAMKIREYPRNVSIITEGDNGQEMFILERGSILVTKGIGISSSLEMAYIIWSILYGPYHMVHMILTLNYIWRNSSFLFWCHIFISVNIEKRCSFKFDPLVDWFFGINCKGTKDNIFFNVYACYFYPWFHVEFIMPSNKLNERLLDKIFSKMIFPFRTRMILVYWVKNLGSVGNNESIPIIRIWISLKRSFYNFSN